MRAGWSVTDWTAGLEEVFSAAFGGHLRKALAGFSLAMARAQSCFGLQIALCLSSSALITSVV